MRVPPILTRSFTEGAFLGKIPMHAQALEQRFGLRQTQHKVHVLHGLSSRRL